jgi:RNA polymerase sigma-70 factor (sigma-E family)
MARDEDFTDYMSSRWSTLVRSAVLLGCSRYDAEDLVQTTLAKCYTGWPKIARADNRDAYVYRMLVNALTDSRRRRWWGERPTADLPDSADPDDALTEIDVSDAVERALAGLSTEQRAVLVLRFFVHLSESETAEALGIAAGTVKSRTSRALAVLAENEHLTNLPEGKTP